MTEAAVKAYQEANGLTVDGKAGQQTLGSMGLIDPSLSQQPKITTGLPSGSTSTLKTTTPSTSTSSQAGIQPTIGGTGELTDPSTTSVGGVSLDLTQNPYLEQLQNMKFEYNPLNDESYLETASMLEQQVTDMMVGRGGLYSSVASSALQRGLLTLQNQMRQSKYQEFQDERAFAFQMVKYYSDIQAQAWQQNFQEKTFEFNVQKEKFDQQMAIASFNEQVAARKFSQEMQMANYRLSASNAAFSRQMAQMENEIRQGQTQAVTQSIAWYNEQATFDALVDRWRSRGTADEQVASFFGVQYGEWIGTTDSIESVVAKTNEMQAWHKSITDFATQVGANEVLASSLYGFGMPPEVPTTPTKEVVKTDYQYDSSGTKIGETRSSYTAPLTSSGTTTTASKQASSLLKQTGTIN
jgi:hypothetical protein